MKRYSESPKLRSLLDWGAELRLPNARRCYRHRTLTTALIASAVCVAPMAVTPAPRLVWNASASAPPGLYVVAPHVPVHSGDMVIANPPPAARRLAAERRYLPEDVPLVKRIAAGPGDVVCATGTEIHIDGRLAARRLFTDPRGRTLPWWTGCERLVAGRYLLLMTAVPTSFDGRYFGPTSARDIIGRAWLLWRR